MSCFPFPLSDEMRDFAEWWEAHKPTCPQCKVCNEQNEETGDLNPICDEAFSKFKEALANDA